jgi:hypothetical protein
MPRLDEYYKSHMGLSIHGRLKPLLKYPVEVLADCSALHFTGDDIWGDGESILNVSPPKQLPGLSLHEWYTLWAEDLRQALAILAKANPKDSKVKRYRRNLEVLEFMRATWDALLIGYQVERAIHLTRYGTYSVLDSRRLQGVNRFRSQLVYHPYEAAKRLKAIAQANRAWYFGGPEPIGRLLRFREKKIAMQASYIARALPPAPPSSEGLKGLMSRLTSTPPPEPSYWKPFVKAYFERWKISRVKDLFTMPSANAALGYPRFVGGHVTGVQHLVLLGYALRKVRGSRESITLDRDDGLGGYLELLSQSLHPSSTGGFEAEKLFKQPWDELEKTLPGAGRYLQSYLKEGTLYVLDNLDIVPILPIVAEERGLKTRFPTCSLTAVNLVQQILRRVIDQCMVQDPRFSEALGGQGGIDMRNESGPWYSQDATAATDYHPQWLTQAVYEELAERYRELRPYRKYFNLLFGPKKILLEDDHEVFPNSFYSPGGLLESYPRAPLLDDRFTPGVKEEEFGHASIILRLWDNWLAFLRDREGVKTTTGQMMGDPTSFPPLMLVSVCAAEQTLREHPYTPKESKRRHPRLKRSEPVMKGIGDDALIPRWTAVRRQCYDGHLGQLAAEISIPKSFWHLVKGLIAEVPTIGGHEVPFWPLSVLVAPPGGSKGHVTWFSQSESFGGDPSRPSKRVPKFFWRLSPYWYTLQTARRLGLPVSAAVSYGGVGYPVYPAASLLWHVQWLSYLSSMPLDKLVVGLGIGPLGASQQGLLDEAARGWLKEVLAARVQWDKEGLELLSGCALTDDGELRVSLKEGFRKAVGQLRSVEFYFRAPPESLEPHAPSVRRAARRFEQKVGHTRLVPTKGYGPTVQDLERKLQIFFSKSGGFLPDPYSRAPGVYGLEESGTVKRRWKAPWVIGVG